MFLVDINVCLEQLGAEDGDTMSDAYSLADFLHEPRGVRSHESRAYMCPWRAGGEETNGLCGSGPTHILPRRPWNSPGR